MENIKYPKSQLPDQWEVNRILNDSQNKNDFEVAIIFQSVIERVIQKRLAALLIHATEPKLRSIFSDFGPLGSFTSKIDILASLLPIAPEIESDLKTIAKIRNRFAHRIEPISFDTNDIKTLCGGLKCNYANSKNHLRSVAEQIFPNQDSQVEYKEDVIYSFLVLTQDERIMAGIEHAIPEIRKTKRLFIESCVILWTSLSIPLLFK